MKKNKNKRINKNGTYEEITVIRPVSFEHHFNKMTKDPAFKKTFDELEPKYAMLRSIMKKRIEKKISQEQLAKSLGTRQSAISRLESGMHNPSFEFLEKLAKALDAKLVIRFE